MQEILAATKNTGNILEYKELFKNLPYKLLTLVNLGIKDSPEEDGKTFTENAIKKAEFYNRFSNLPSLAEDSGLEIEEAKIAHRKKALEKLIPKIHELI